MRRFQSSLPLAAVLVACSSSATDGKPGTDDSGQVLDSGADSDTDSDSGTDSPDSPQPVRVYLLAGQSNMEGYGPLTDADLDGWPLTGSLEALVDGGLEDPAILQPREDVWVHFDSDSEVHAPGLLEPGFGASPRFVGPELGMGQELGDAAGGSIILYKSATGGTTLGRDWRSPASGETGPLYSRMIDGFGDFMDSELPEGFADADFADEGVELAGFVWLQGWNDQFEDGFVDAYEDNLVALIQDVRTDLGAPELPVVVVEGPTLLEELRQARLGAIARLDAEVPGRQRHVATEDLVEEDLEGNFHFHYNAANYLEVGRRTAAAIQSFD